MYLVLVDLLFGPVRVSVPLPLLAFTPLPVAKTAIGDVVQRKKRKKEKKKGAVCLSSSAPSLFR